MSPTSVPFTSLLLGKNTFQITTSVGRSLHTYDLSKGLNLVFLTRPQTPGDVTAIFAWKDRVFAAWRCGSHVGIWGFKRGKKVEELELDGSESINKLIVFGTWIVASCTTRIEVWKSTTGEHYTTLAPTISTKAGGVLSGGMCNMPTILNKIVVGKQDGALDIWNVSTGKLIYTILPPSASSGRVTAMEPTPALALLAVARADGSITIHDVRSDKTVLRLNTEKHHSSTISSISFRSDGLGAVDDASKAGIMATATTGSGNVTFWDLNHGGRITGVLRGAHTPPCFDTHPINPVGINRVEFLPGQDVMITSGLDNALKSWIFDANSLSPTPRILHSRRGHTAPITRLTFMPSNSDGADTEGKWLMSAGRDQSLRAWSLRRDGQSTELSQGSVQKKATRLGIRAGALRAPEITSIACSLTRDGGMGASSGSGGVWTNKTSKKGFAASKKGSTDASESNATGWESVVTGHYESSYARTWFWGSKKAGRWAFKTSDDRNVTSVAVTSCGTFALVGSSGGSITSFNLQSGVQRQKFPPIRTPEQARILKMDRPAAKDVISIRLNMSRKYLLSVTGLMVDDLNKTLFSCGLDGKIKFWDFQTGLLQDEVDWSSMVSIIASQYHRPSDLIALSCDDQSIRVVDTETKKLVRELWGCLGEITDFCFSNDGRWIIAASMDSIIRVWDLPTSHLINAVLVESPCTSLAFSDTGEFLATAHADSVGINIWNNRTLFTHVPTRPLKEDETRSAIAVTPSGATGIIDAAFDEEADEKVTEPGYNDLAPTDQLGFDMLTLSPVPESHLQYHLDLDAIWQRNRPKESPEAPEKVPFFLPSLDRARIPEPTKADEHNKNTLAPRSRIIKTDSAASASQFTTALPAAKRGTDYAPFLEHLKSLSPSTADIEIRSLNPEKLASFVYALTFQLRKKRDYNLVQAWMRVFLRIHRDIIPGNADLRQALMKWQEWQRREAKRLGDLVGSCAGVADFLRSERT